MKSVCSGARSISMDGLLVFGSVHGHLVFETFHVVYVTCTQAEAAREATTAMAVPLSADHPEPTAMVLRHL